jgi:hypothetical protein
VLLASAVPPSMKPSSIALWLFLVCNSTTGFAQSPVQLHAEIVVQQHQILALPQQIAALQKRVTDTAALETNDAAGIAKQQSLMLDVRSSNIWALNPFLKVNLAAENGVNGPNISLVGVNLHLLSGSGVTSDFSDGGSAPNPLGRGNLFIGYNEPPVPIVAALASGDRSGSHNLIMGRYNKFRSFGSIVSGEYNTVTAAESSIIKGGGNRLGGRSSTMIGASNSVVDGGGFVCIFGGEQNIATGCDLFALFGGQQNAISSARYETVIGVDYLATPAQ